MDKFSKNVVLAHGLLTKSPIMAYLAYQLRQLGYRTHFFNYRTLHFDSETTMSTLKQLCDGLDNIYFVGHSMGGLVLREFIQQHPSDKYKSVVTLGTPHSSSEFAKLVSKSELNNLLGINDKSGLITDLKDYKGKPPLGSLAGDKAKGMFQFYSRWAGQDTIEPNDGTVLVRETMDVNFKDHIVLPVSHSGMLISKDVVEQIDYFFTNQKFKKRLI